MAGGEVMEYGEYSSSLRGTKTTNTTTVQLFDFSSALGCVKVTSLCPSSTYLVKGLNSTQKEY